MFCNKISKRFNLQVISIHDKISVVKIMIIGITGKSGAGKSYLSDILAQTLGFIHPRTKEYLEFSRPAPDYFYETLEKIRNGELDK